LVQIAKQTKKLFEFPIWHHANLTIGAIVKVGEGNQKCLSSQTKEG
jgi:hypothetical protein